MAIGHGTASSYAGGSIGDARRSLRTIFVFAAQVPAFAAAIEHRGAVATFAIIPAGRLRVSWSSARWRWGTLIVEVSVELTPAVVGAIVVLNVGEKLEASEHCWSTVSVPERVAVEPPLLGVSTAEPVGVPQVRGIEITGVVPPRKVIAKAVNGTSGRPVNEAEATPVEPSTSTVPVSLTCTLG